MHAAWERDDASFNCKYYANAAPFDASKFTGYTDGGEVPIDFTDCLNEKEVFDLLD